jgi:hypothetical protein
MVVQTSPCRPGGEVDHDDAVGSLIGRIGDVGDAGLPLTQIESDVIEIGGGQGDVGFEHDRLHHLVDGEVDAHELGPAAFGRAELGAAGVEDP